MKENSRNNTTSRALLGLLAVASVPAGLLAASLSNLTVSDTAEFGSGAIFGSSIIPTVSIGWGNTPATNGLAVGEGLVAAHNNAVIVGQYNEVLGAHRFTVGIGAGGSGPETANAFEVLTDGTVVVNQVQGDIQTGEFGE